MSRAPEDVVAEMTRRDVHVRQYLGVRFELWADGERKATLYRPAEAEAALRELLGLTVGEGLAVQRTLERKGQA